MGQSSPVDADDLRLADPPGRPAAPAKRTRIAALLAASVVFFLITLDSIIVSIGLAGIEHALGGGIQGQQWMLNAYFVAFAVFLLLGGSLSDSMGARRALLIGAAVLAIASFAAAAAPELTVLIAARAGQGLASAILLPASMGLIRETYPDTADRARALGLWVIGGAVAVASGGPLGGIFAALDWRLIFAINIPACLCAMLLLIPVPKSPQWPTTFDWLGQILIVLGLGGLVFALVRGGAEGFGSPWVIGAAAVALPALALFVVVERRVRAPMLPLQLFGIRSLRIAFAFAFAFMLGWMGCIFVVSLYLQQVLGLTALETGLLFVPSAIASGVLNACSGTLVARFGIRTTAILGLTPMVAGFVGLAIAVHSPSPLVISLLVVLVAAGGALSSPAMMGLMLTNSSARYAGIASGAFNSFRQVGGAVAVAAFGILIADADWFVHGAQWSFTICALSLGTALALAFRIRRSDERGPGSPQTA